MLICTTPLPVVSIGAADGSATENADGEEADPAVFRLSRSGNTSQPLTVQLTTRGTATSSDFSLPSSVTIPAGQAWMDVTMDVIDDPDAEGVETVVVDVAQPGAGDIYILAAPAGTGAATVQTVIDDDTKVRTIVAKVIPSKDPVLRNFNTFNEYYFWVEIAFEGEHLDRVDFEQRLWCTTKLEKPNAPGEFYTDAQVLAVIRQITPDADPNLANSELLEDGKKPIDQGWSRKNLAEDHDIVPETRNRKAIRYDMQGILDPDDQHHRGSRCVHLLGRCVTPVLPLTHSKSVAVPYSRACEWGYTWTNRACKWRRWGQPHASNKLTLRYHTRTTARASSTHSSLRS